MNDHSHSQLLRNYAEARSEAAFAELVRRHVDCIYSAALRMVCDPHLAEDVTQGVFMALARSATRLLECPLLAGWLHRTAQNIAAQTVRTIERRRAREQEAAAMNELLAGQTDASWERIAPHLDDALNDLSETDREAVLLRYFHNRDFHSVGRALGVSDDTAQKRVSRAVERLRQHCARRDVTVGTTGLVAVISANAVQAAPVGLSATISTAAALVGPTLATSATVTAAKAIAMTTLQKALIAVTIVILSGTGIYKARQASLLRNEVTALQTQQAEQIKHLQDERDEALKRLASLSGKPAPRLPAPQLQVAVRPVESLQATNLYDRFKDKQPKLTARQVEPYLRANGRNAASLLASYRTTGDAALLAEAMQKFPNDPQVAFEAAFKTDSSPVERHQWLEAFKKSDPENSLPNYLSARGAFLAGNADLAVQELIAASGKKLFQDYTPERMQDDEEAYLAAGYSVAEAKTIPGSQLLLPQLKQMKTLASDLVNLADSYRQAGDESSAQASLQIAANLGQRYRDTPGETEISWLVGMAVERIALSEMDPNSAYGSDGQTVQDRINQLAQKNSELKQLNQRLEPLLPNLSDQDWISYKDRWRAFGEEAAIQWVVNKYGQK